MCAPLASMDAEECGKPAEGFLLVLKCLKDMRSCDAHEVCFAENGGYSLKVVLTVSSLALLSRRDKKNHNNIHDEGIELEVSIYDNNRSHSQQSHARSGQCLDSKSSPHDASSGVVHFVRSISSWGHMDVMEKGKSNNGTGTKVGGHSKPARSRVLPSAILLGGPPSSAEYTFTAVSNTSVVAMLYDTQNTERPPPCSHSAHLQGITWTVNSYQDWKQC